MGAQHFEKLRPTTGMLYIWKPGQEQMGFSVSTHVTPRSR